MLNYKKKAFTITELVIVIAVVAILAAVLIPTFSNVVEKANQSADMQAVRNANTALANAEILDGKPASSIGEALAVVAQAGYNVESFTPSSNGDILWDEVNNRFALVDEEGKVVLNDQAKPLEESRIVKKGENRTSLDVWMITDNKAEIESGRYSYYLKEGVTGDVTVKTGVDVGVNEDVNVIYSTSATQSVYIRTNGCKLTVDASGSDVHHHGTASEVVINSVKTESYHEYGTVETTITLKSGHVVLESTAVVPEIKVTGSVTVTNKTGKDVAITPADDNVGDVTVDGKEVFTVSFANEGKQVAKQLIVDGDKARDPELALEKTGYTFKGWYKGEIKFDFAKDVVTADTTLNARWTPNEYKVTFVSEEVEVAPITVTYDAEYTLPTPTRTGYTFAGWVDSEGNPYGNGTWQGTSDLELTAKWTINTYTVTFNVENITVPSQTVNYGSTATEPTVDGGDYAVVGWYTDATFTTKFDFTQKITKATTVYGKVGKLIKTAADLEAELQNEAGAEVICLANGTYEFDHPVTISRDVEIVGDNMPTLLYTAAGDVFNPVFLLIGAVDDNDNVIPIDVSLIGLKIVNDVKDGDWESGISFGYRDTFLSFLTEYEFKGHGVIENCVIEGFTRHSIIVSGSGQEDPNTSVVITGTEIALEYFDGDGGFTPYGISVINAKNVTISNNKFYGLPIANELFSVDAVLITQRGHADVYGNTFDRCTGSIVASTFWSGEGDNPNPTYTEHDNIFVRTALPSFEYNAEDETELLVSTLDGDAFIYRNETNADGYDVRIKTGNGFSFAAFDANTSTPTDILNAIKASENPDPYLARWNNTLTKISVVDGKGNLIATWTREKTGDTWGEWVKQ